MISLICTTAPGCQSVRSPASRPAPRWVCALPESWNGLLDTNPVGTPVRLAAGPDGTVGIVWGQHTLKMVVLGPEGTEASDTLRDFVGPDPLRLNEHADLGNLLYAHGKWRVPVVLPNGGIILARFDAKGWERPVVVVPRVAPTDLWLCVEDDTSHIFWTELVNPGPVLTLFHLLTLGSIENASSWALCHAVVKHDKAIGINEAYRQSYSRLPRDSWMTSHVLDLGQGRYDFFVVCNPPGERSPEKLVHIGNVLGLWKSLPMCIGKGDLFVDSIAFALPGGIIQAFGLTRTWGLKEAAISRIFEVHMEEGVWSPPRTIAQGMCEKRWEISGLAAASFPMDRQQGVIVIWQNEEGHLAYAVGTPDHRWSEPVHTDWRIGWPNQLVYARDRFVLVTVLPTSANVPVQGAATRPANTKDELALYWCSFTLTQQCTAEQPGDRRTPDCEP